MHILDTFWRDARHGARSLARTPGFTLAAILTLSLGIGANTAIFSVFDAVLLAPLPYGEPDRRVMIWSQWISFDRTWVSDAEVLDYRERCQTLEDVAAWGSGQANLTGDGEPIRVGVARVTWNIFDVLGARPFVGRTFREEEARPGLQANVAIVSYGLWQRRYAGDPEIVGRTLLLNGVARTIVGVMPRGFQLPTDFHEDAAEPTQLWLPFRLDPENRGSHGLYAAAVLRPGATAEAATAELRAVATSLTEEGKYPAPMQFSAFAVAMHDEILGTVEGALLLLFGAVAFLLLIACANVASLLLARAETRQRELALRVALGAGRGRLARQLFAEGLVLACLSGAAGLLLAYGGVGLLATVDPGNIPRLAGVELDSRALLFTAILAVTTTMVFSVAPVLRALQVGLTESLKEGGHQSTAGGRRQRLRSALVIAQIGLAVTLVIGAGLMIRSLAALQRIDIGFDPENVLTMRLSLPEAAYEQPEQVVGFYGALLERVRSLPGVRQAGLVRVLPLGGTIGDWSVQVEGYDPPPGHSAKGDWQVVSDGGIEALGERLIRGRPIAATDTPDAQQVAVINETMARTYWAGQDPIGRRFRMGGPERPWITIAGIVGDVRHNGMTAVVKEKFYRPLSQFHLSSGSPVRTMTLVVRTEGDPLALAAPIRAEVRAMDANLPIANVRRMRDVVAASLSTPRFTGMLLALFATLALLLAAVGIYGVLSYLVSRRSHEIGIRMAIGASARQVGGMVLRQGCRLAIIGALAGVGAAFALTRVMASLLHEVQPTDALTFTAAPIALLSVAVLASYLPARRATRVDPIAALRVE